MRRTKSSAPPPFTLRTVETTTGASLPNFGICDPRMARLPAYPPDLAQYVESHWPSTSALTLPRRLLDDALSVAFQASLTSEEARTTRFRLLLTPLDKLPETGVPN